MGRPPFRTGAVYNGSQNWFYIKFEDPLAAARAVSQSPLILSAPLTHRREETITAPAGAVTEKDMNGASVREEVVGITWCTDEAFLQQQIKQEQMQSSTAEEWAGSRGNGTATERSGESQGEKDNGIRNALGITPCGVDRLRRSPTPSPPSEKCSQRQRRAHSRGLISLIREVLYSPWSGQWTKGSSRQEFTPQDSSHGRNAYDKPSDDNSTLSSCSADTHTDVFRGDSFSEQNNNTRSGRSVVSNADPMGYPFDGAGIPSGHLHCRRRHYHTPEEQIKSGKPIRPLPGNSSVMCAFKADVSQRSLLKRIVRGALYAPSRIIHFLSERELGTEGERSYFNVAGEAPPTPCEDWDVSARRQSLVRNRHFNAESRLYSLNTRQTGQTSSLVLAEWAPARWHENRILFSLLVVIMLFVFPYTTSQVDLSSTFTWSAGDISSSQEKVLNNNAYAGSGHQPDADTVQNVVLTSSGYRSDKYRARTL
uniref:Uncharacterized protein TCIL3000_10_3160 n=1 Tax=Trypanosoma congolense (strain IL3000) TaxID=1068625 RepID=G0UVY9_TRYCI|nr:unnamed protein product [Trypanosoma congolense IL3000]